MRCSASVLRLLAQVKGLDVIPGLRRDLEASSRDTERLTSQRDDYKVAPKEFTLVPRNAMDGHVLAGSFPAESCLMLVSHSCLADHRCNECAVSGPRQM